jgi:hypothetical protein
LRLAGAIVALARARGMCEGDLAGGERESRTQERA